MNPYAFAVAVKWANFCPTLIKKECMKMKLGHPR